MEKQNRSPLLTRCLLYPFQTPPWWWFVTGDRTLPAACCGNLSLEPVCCPSALQRLLVGSVCCPAVLRHHVCEHHCWPPGDSILPAVKVWPCICCCVDSWRCAFATLYNSDFFFLLHPSVSECCATPYSLLGLTFVVSYLALGLLNLCKFYLGGYAAVQNENVMHRWGVAVQGHRLCLNLCVSHFYCKIAEAYKRES